MMPLDPSIFARFAPKSVQDYDREALDTQTAQQNSQLNALKLLQGKDALADTQRQRGEQDAIRNAMMGAGSDDERVRRLFGLGTQTAFSTADTLRKGMIERQKAESQSLENKANAQKSTAAAVSDTLKQYRGALDFIDTPQGAQRWLAAQYQDPALAQHMQALGPLDQAVQRIPQDPQGFQQWRAQAGLGMEAYQKQLMEGSDKRALREETARHNKAGEATAQGQLGVAQANLGLSRQRLEAEKAAPKGVITQTDQGPVLVDPRTGTALPLTMNGETLGPKMKDIPASANTAILTNSQNLTKVQQAIDLLEGKDAGVMKGDKSATGAKAYLPNGLLNRLDPGGVDTRAAIADIGSLIIHDRSGANVTASESPRLMPFIPLTTDDNATAAKKLKRFKQLYEAEAGGLASAYGADSGYRQPGRGGKGPATPGAPAGGGGLTPAEQDELTRLRKQFGK